MNIERITRQAWFSWAALGLLAALCCGLAVLQYGWIGEISRAERERLRENLHASLEQLSRAFNAEVTSACAALLPSNASVEELGREPAYAARYMQWAAAAGKLTPMFRRIALAVPAGGGLILRMLDLKSGAFQDAEWPPEWESMRARLNARLALEPAIPPLETTALLEFPRFDRPIRPGPPQRLAELDWLLVEIDSEYLAGETLPRLLQRYLGVGGVLDYDAQVTLRSDRSTVLYRTFADPGRRIGRDADGAVPLFDPLPIELARRGGRGGRPAEFDGRFEGRSGGGFTRGFRGPGRSRWELVVRHKGGSLEAIVGRARVRHVAVSGAILAMILASASLLVKLSRRAHTLAESQMNFVAGVSHELRTPLTVIRTAAYNLRKRFSGDPAQVVRYGTLIEQESQKLTALVEQVMRYAGAGSGRVIREREPVAVESLIEQGIDSSRAAIDEARCTVETRIDSNLPLVLADGMALKHAIQNLVENALKYGAEGGNWIGVTASRVSGAGGDAVEIRVADRGPGIPPEEQEQIFDPFFRGRRAIQDQIHGTGLGLNLVKKIVEAHGGTIRVHSEPMKGAEFVIRIPAAPAEQQDEFAHSLG